MYINSSTVGMNSNRSFTSSASLSYRFSFSRSTMALGHQTIGGGSGGSPQAEKENNKSGQVNDIESLRAKLNGFASRIGSEISIKSSDNPFAILRDIRMQCLDYLFNAFNMGGRSLSSSYFKESQSDFVSGGGSGTSGQASQTGTEMRSVNVFNQEWSHGYQESELTAFNTQGKVVCADGREIEFNMNMTMSRSYEEYYQVNQTRVLSALCDPLVINLDGNIAELTDQTFFFDIDGDGTEDNISRLGSGSGYLALDKNNDGVINDGNELFGSASGDGFADLARYDTDRDGWIDEDDEIWKDLKIWVTDERGNNRLYSLADKGVGAICLSNVDTDFALTTETNDVKGYIRKSGMFLYENGAVGSVQHVDVAKYDNIS